MSFFLFNSLVLLEQSFSGADDYCRHDPRAKATQEIKRKVWGWKILNGKLFWKYINSFSCKRVLAARWVASRDLTMVHINGPVITKLASSILLDEESQVTSGGLQALQEEYHGLIRSKLMMLYKTHHAGRHKTNWGPIHNKSFICHITFPLLKYWLCPWRWMNELGFESQ